MNDEPLPPDQMTEEDLAFPVYCTSCIAHISRATANRNDGLCDDCAPQPLTPTEILPRGAAQIPNGPEAPPIAPPMQAPLAFCPVCQQVSVQETFLPSNNSSKAILWVLAGITFVAGFCCMFWLWGLTMMFALIAIVSPPAAARVSRQCLSCGQKWN